MERVGFWEALFETLGALFRAIESNPEALDKDYVSPMCGCAGDHCPRMRHLRAHLNALFARLDPAALEEPERTVHAALESAARELEE